MLAIKLKRIGKKHQPAYRLIVAEKKSSMNGRYVEDLGYWNPESEKKEINTERIAYWMKNGAQPTDTVYNMLIDLKLVSGKKIPMHNTPKKKEGEKKEEVKAAA